jgi:hypothetical protein
VKLRHPDYIVTGTGRSGTSFVAHVLHKELGVCMGHIMDTRPSPAHRVGNYEDAEMRKEHLKLLGRRISPDQWLERFTLIHRRCKGPCGVKHPDTAFFGLDDWEEIAPRWIIWAWRRPEQVDRSKRKWGNPFGPWRREKALRRLAELERKWSNIIRLDLSIERSVEWVREQIHTATEGSAKS